MRKNNLELLTGILQQFDRETIFSVVGKLTKGSTDCGPDFASAIKPGEWMADEAEADKSAYKKAKEAAGRACAGKCPGTQKCKYIQTSAELLGTETKKNDHNVKLYRSKAKSGGLCKCEEKE